MWRIKPDLDALLRYLDCYQWHRGTLNKIQFIHPIEAQALALKRSINRKEGSDQEANNSTVWKQQEEVVRLCHYHVTMEERFKYRKETTVAWFMGPHFNYLYS